MITLWGDLSQGRVENGGSPSPERSAQTLNEGSTLLPNLGEHQQNKALQLQEIQAQKGDAIRFPYYVSLQYLPSVELAPDPTTIGQAI